MDELCQVLGVDRDLEGVSFSELAMHVDDMLRFDSLGVSVPQSIEVFFQQIDRTVFNPVFIYVGYMFLAALQIREPTCQFFLTKLFLSFN